MSSPNPVRRFDPRYVVASLVGADTSETPSSYESYDGSLDPSWSNIYNARDVDVERPKDETSEYYRLYETMSFIGTPIDQVITEVFEPGFYIEADSEETVSELTEFCNNIAYSAGRPKFPLPKMGQQALRQYFVRGDWLAEKMTDDKDRHLGISPVQKETFEIYTRPSLNVLLAPDDVDYDDVKLTDDGEAASYVQFDSTYNRFSDTKERRFTRDEIIHWPRSPDVGDVWGTSIIERVYDRALALEAKLRDNDDAIAFKAWPMVLFQTGTAENPWTEAEQDEFMSAYSNGRFGPGMYQAVPGDVDVTEFAGETADIESHVETDLNVIMAGMPGPKYSLGAFTANVSTTIASAQERQYRKLVRRLRRDFEELMMPYLREVADSWGLDPDGIELKIARPAGEVDPDMVSGNIIRYTSDVSGQPADATIDERDDEGHVDDGDGDAPSDPGRDRSDVVPNMTELAMPEEYAHVHDDEGSEELADPRLVGTDDVQRELRSVISDILIRTREDAIEQVQNRRSEKMAASMVDAVSKRSMSAAIDEASLAVTADALLSDVRRRTLDTMAQQNHSPQILSSNSSVANHSTRQYVQLREDLRSFTRDLADAVRSSSDGRGDLSDRGAERIRRSFDDETMRERATILTRTRVYQTVNRIKLDAYRSHADVIGVKVTNRCTADTDELCQQLAGCGGNESATAMFDEERSIGDQLESSVTAELHSEFDPLPSVPPFHHGCFSEIVPVVDAE